MSETRDEKGKSLLTLLDNFVILDLETTGLDPEMDDIIEVGALKIVNGKIADKFNSLVNPLYNLGDFITELTGIANEMLKDAPVLKEILPSLISFIGDDVVMAHNANFDVNFLYDNCVNLLDETFRNDFIDTLRMSRRIFKDLHSFSLSVLVEKFNLDGGVEHRAIGDCYCVYNLYEYICNYIAKNNIAVESIFYTKKASVRSVDVTAQNLAFDENHPVYGKGFVFTGTLLRMTRKEAMQIVADLGGINCDNVTKKVNFLVLGNNDYCSQIKGGKSNKQQKAEALMLEGKDIVVLSENAFFDMTKEEG